MAIQLSLFDSNYNPVGAMSAPAVVDTSDTNPMELVDSILNPCKGCPLHGVCDDDQCAMFDWPTDLPVTRFHDLEQYIQFMKHHGFL